MTRDELDDIQGVRDHWALGLYGDTGLAKRAGATVLAIDKLMAELDDLRARLARAEQAYEDLHKRIRPISWACEVSGCQHERLEATIARLTAERGELQAAFRDLTDAYNELLNAQVIDDQPSAERDARKGMP